MAKRTEIDSTERARALESAISQIEKKFGKGSIMKLGDGTVLPVEVIPTGSIALDMALGVGGVPRGRIVEIYGQEASGKTTLCLHIIAEAQKLGGLAAFIDVENALDPKYAQAIGIDLDSLLISQPDDGEQALEIAETLIRSNAIDVIVIDSVAALTPRAEIEGDMGDAHVGLQARLMSQALRKLTNVVNKTQTCLIFTNQIREKIGVYGNPETTPGGRALKFYASIRMEMRGADTMRSGAETIGRRIRVKVAKNKVAPPFAEASFEILFGEGISKEGDLLDIAAEREIVERSGSWYSYGEIRLGQGRENAKQFLRENPEIAAEIERKIRDAFRPTVVTESNEEIEQEENAEDLTNS